MQHLGPRRMEGHEGEAGRVEGVRDEEVRAFLSRMTPSQRRALGSACSLSFVHDLEFDKVQSADNMLPSVIVPVIEGRPADSTEVVGEGTVREPRANMVQGRRDVHVDVNEEAVERGRQPMNCVRQENLEQAKEEMR